MACLVVKENREDKRIIVVLEEEEKTLSSPIGKKREKRKYKMINVFIYSPLIIYM